MLVFFYKTFHILLYSCSFIKRCGMHIAHAVLEVNASLHFLFLTKTCLFLVSSFYSDSYIGIVLYFHLFAKHELRLLVQ